jgi:hypothetical protein
MDPILIFTSKLSFYLFFLSPSSKIITNHVNKVQIFQTNFLVGTSHMSSKSEGVYKENFKNKSMKFEIELSDDFSGPEIWKKISTDVSRPLE